LGKTEIPVEGEEREWEGREQNGGETLAEKIL